MIKKIQIFTLFTANINVLRSSKAAVSNPNCIFFILELQDNIEQPTLFLAHSGLFQNHFHFLVVLHTGFKVGNNSSIQGVISIIRFINCHFEDIWFQAHI
jgi:hypothetical protein